MLSEVSVGAVLPTADTTDTSLNISATAGHIALVNSTTALSGSCPSSSRIIDKNGYGTTQTTCNEGGANAPAGSNTTSDQRGNSGCTDTDSNSSDFTAAAPNPHNSASATHTCAPTATITTTAVSVCSGNSTVLSADLTGQGPWT